MVRNRWCSEYFFYQGHIFLCMPLKTMRAGMGFSYPLQLIPDDAFCLGPVMCHKYLFAPWRSHPHPHVRLHRYPPQDNPADFSFYFDTTEQHNCYLAPERFYNPKEGTPDFDDPVTEKMDVFAAGWELLGLVLGKYAGPGLLPRTMHGPTPACLCPWTIMS